MEKNRAQSLQNLYLAFVLLLGWNPCLEYRSAVTAGMLTVILLLPPKNPAL